MNRLLTQYCLWLLGAFFSVNASFAQVVTDTLSRGSIPAGNFYVPLAGFYPTSATTGDTVYLRMMLPSSFNSVKFGGAPAASYTGGEFDALIKAVVGTGASGNITVGFPTGSTTLPNFTFLPPSADQFVSLCGTNANARMISNRQGVNYRWQTSTDSIHFNDIADSGVFSGTTTNTLRLTGISREANGRRFRCLADSVPSKVFTLRFENIWLGGASVLPGTPWNSTYAWSCGVIPDANTNVVINNGTVTVDTNTTVNSLTLMPGATLNVLPGVILRVLH